MVFGPTLNEVSIEASYLIPVSRYMAPAICMCIVLVGIGWLTGVVVSLLGSYLSFTLDFPTGGMVVVVLGVALLIVAVFKGFRLRMAK